MKRLLCLDGPENGLYASANDPPDGYYLSWWPTGEPVLMHAAGIIGTLLEEETA